MGNCKGKCQPVKTIRNKFAAQKVKMQYHIDKDIIGEGAFAKVYKGYNLANPKIKVAIKSIHKLDLCPEDLKAIHDEVDALKALNHPKIVTYFDMFEDDLFMFIVTELWKGTTVGHQLKNGKLYSENDVKFITYQLITAINHCHINKVWHRDIKPDNIMIDDNLNITLIDFGLSKLDTRNRFKSILGSPVYMAPEIVKEKYTKKWDIWSLGVLVYRLISGKLPYDGNSFEEIQRKKLNNNLSFKSTSDRFSLEAINFIQKCIVVNHHERYSAEKLLEHDWFDDLRDKTNESVTTVTDTSRKIIEYFTRSKTI